MDFVNRSLQVQHLEFVEVDTNKSYRIAFNQNKTFNFVFIDLKNLVIKSNQSFFNFSFRTFRLSIRRCR